MVQGAWGPEYDLQNPWGTGEALVLLTRSKAGFQELEGWPVQHTQWQTTKTVSNKVEETGI